MTPLVSIFLLNIFVRMRPTSILTPLRPHLARGDKVAD
jgi:hypothetical protein